VEKKLSSVFCFLARNCFAAAAVTGLSKLAATLIGAGFGMARSKSTGGGAAGVAPEGVAPKFECTVVVAAGAAPAAPTGAELVLTFRGLAGVCVS
jgi:hypothetical protein